ncbi:MAG: substrate-binding domain-containing protein [Armatimonas sp.]
MKKSGWLSLSALVALVLAGCPSSPPAGGTEGTAQGTTTGGGAPAGAKKTVAVIPKGLTHDFWQSVKRGAEKAGGEFSVNIKWDGPQKENDTAGQIGVVENAINQHVDGIVLAPLDKAALVGVIKKANDAKIPVTVFDSAANVGEDAYVSFVATDNKKGGELAAMRMGEILGGKGKVGLIPNQANSASTEDRESGFEETLKAKFPGITLIKASYADSDPTKAIRVAEDLLSANPDIVGVFGSCEPCAVGALQAAKNKNLLSKVKVIGFDNTKLMDAALVKGEMDSLVVQNPAKMGYEGVKSIIDSAGGKKVEKRIDTGCVLLKKDNLDSADMAEFRAK